jgi:accessory gene regulator B
MEKLSRKVIARFCASGTIQEDDRELYEYALNILLTGILHFLLSLLIGLSLGMIKESLALFASFFVVRKFAGGFHAAKPWQCYLFSIATNVALLLLIRFLLKQIDVLYYVCLILPLPFILLLSPAESPNKPLNAKEKKAYRLIACILCCVVAGLSVIVFRWASKPIGVALCMGLVAESLVLVLAAVEKLLRARTVRAD